MLGNLVWSLIPLTTTCYRLDIARVLLPSAAKSALSFTLDTTSRLITLMPFSSRCKALPGLWANLLGLFHCSLTVTTIVELCVTILRPAPEWELGAPVVTSLLPGCCPATESLGSWLWLPRARSWQMSPALLSGITNHSRPQIQDICKPSTCSKTWPALTWTFCSFPSRQASVQQNSNYLFVWLFQHFHGLQLFLSQLKVRALWGQNYFINLIIIWTILNHWT